MPKKVRTLEDVVADLRGLSERAAENASDLPDITAERNTLDRSLESFDDARRRQQIHEAEKRKATQDMRTALGRGQEAARQIRLAVKVGLGARNEMLSLYNVAPLRTNAGRKAAVLQPPEEPTGGTTGAPAPKHPTNP